MYSGPMYKGGLHVIKNTKHRKRTSQVLPRVALAIYLHKDEVMCARSRQPSTPSAGAQGGEQKRAPCAQGKTRQDGSSYDS